MIDNKISLVLEKVRKFVKGPRRLIPYSATKAKVREELLYWTAMKKVKQYSYNSKKKRRSRYRNRN